MGLTDPTESKDSQILKPVGAAGKKCLRYQVSSQFVTLGFSSLFKTCHRNPPLMEVSRIFCNAMFPVLHSGCCFK